MNARDFPSRKRTCLIWIVDPHEHKSEYNNDCVLWNAYPLQKKVAVHMFDGVKAEARSACSLAHCPSTIKERAG